MKVWITIGQAVMAGLPFTAGSMVRRFETNVFNVECSNSLMENNVEPLRPIRVVISLYIVSELICWARLLDHWLVHVWF